jgi:hypothetical protein
MNRVTYHVVNDKEHIFEVLKVDPFRSKEVTIKNIIF